MKKEIRTKLRNRAVAMAREKVEEGKNSATLDIIEFILAKETYGIESEFVREVYHLKEFASLPAVPEYILGIINVRGQILPVIDIKKFFSLPDKGLGELNKVIILNSLQMEFGILADVVYGARTIGIDEILPLPPTVSDIGEEYLKGVTKENLIILNGERLLSDKKLVVNINV